MNEEVRKVLLTSLQERQVWSQFDLAHHLISQGHDEYEVNRTIPLLVDGGEAERFGQDNQYIRITLAGVHNAAPLPLRFKRYMVEYLSTHWLAVFATIISLIALFKKS